MLFSSITFASKISILTVFFHDSEFYCQNSLAFLKFVIIREFYKFFKFIKFAFSICAYPHHHHHHHHRVALVLFPHLFLRSSSITPSILHSRLKTFVFHKFVPTVAFPFFFGINSADSPDCLPILLSISVFLLFSFSLLHFLVIGFVR